MLLDLAWVGQTETWDKFHVLFFFPYFSIFYEVLFEVLFLKPVYRRAKIIIHYLLQCLFLFVCGFFVDFIFGWSSLVPRPPFLAALVGRHSWLNSCSSCTISQWTESYSNGKYRYLSRVFFRQLASVPCLTSFGFERSFNLFCLQWNLYYTHWTISFVCRES